MTEFAIKILDQHWMSTMDNEDLCSHGKFELIIAGEKILGETDDIVWTISTSTLNLLRCIESNHMAHDNYDLILHCGGLAMLSCPIAIYLDLIHDDEKIRIENVRKQFGVSDSEVISFANMKIEIVKKDFARTVLTVAKEVMEFFLLSPIEFSLVMKIKNSGILSGLNFANCTITALRNTTANSA